MSTPDEFTSKLKSRARIGQAFQFLCLISTLLSAVILAVFLTGIFAKGAGNISWSFLTSYDSRHPDQAGILAGIWGSLWLLVLTALFSVPLGIGTAIYLEEFARKGRLKHFIQLNISNLAGVPSIVYGILGLTVFVRMFGVYQGESKVIAINLLFTTLQIPIPFGRSLISGSLTLSLLILPVIIVSAQEALRAVPSSIRHASLALGASKWQTIWHQILPASMSGIVTGIILSLSRAIGETAPLVMIGALSYVAFTPGDLSSPIDFVQNPKAVIEAPFDGFTALPIQIFNWGTRPKEEFQDVAAAGIVVLLCVLLLVNGTAMYIRYRHHKNSKW